jgi:hypothetical protein
MLCDLSASGPTGWGANRRRSHSRAFALQSRFAVDIRLTDNRLGNWGARRVARGNAYQVPIQSGVFLFTVLLLEGSPP